MTKHWTLALTLALFLNAATAEIRLSYFSNKILDPDRPSSSNETRPLEPAMRAYAAQLSAVSPEWHWSFVTKSLPFILFFGETKYYIYPAKFMAKDHPDEVCTPARYTKESPYKCEEGQSHKKSCHLLFFDSAFQPVGAHRIRINENFEVYCNAVPAMGVYNRARNELLVTYQYFPINRKLASTISEIGEGWIRATSLFRLREEGGKILVEQDDACLKNPNRYETIPDARKALKTCAARRR